MANLKQISRKGKLLQTELRKIEDLMATPARIQDIPARLKITAEWFHELRKNDPRVNDAIDKGRARLHENLVGPLFRKATDENEPDIELAKWLLTRIFETYNVNAKRAAAANVDNRTVNLIQIPEAMTPEQYRNLLQGLNVPPILEQDVIEHDSERD